MCCYSKLQFPRYRSRLFVICEDDYGRGKGVETDHTKVSGISEIIDKKLEDGVTSFYVVDMTICDQPSFYLNDKLNRMWVQCDVLEDTKFTCPDPYDFRTHPDTVHKYVSRWILVDGYRVYEDGFITYIEFFKGCEPIFKENLRNRFFDFYHRGRMEKVPQVIEMVEVI